MKGRRRFPLAKTARKIIIIALAGVCLVIAGFFLSRWRGQPRIEVADRKIPSQKIESQEKVRHFVYKGDKGRIELKADKNFVGADGLFQLEGNVEVVQYGLNDRPPIIIKGNEVAYDKDFLRIKFKGEVRVRCRDTDIKTSQLEYVKADEVITTDQGVEFESRKGKGSALRMSYWINQERLLFQDKVVFDAKTTANKAETVHIEGDSLEYNRQSRRGLVKGNVSLLMGRSRASAGRLSFDLTGTGERFRIVLLEENVTASVVHGGGSAERSIEAGSLRLRVFPDTDQVRTLEAKNGCRAVFPLASGVPAEITAPQLKASFDREGRLRTLGAKGGVQVVERATGDSGERTISGDSLAVNGKEETMIFFSDGEKGVSRMASPQAELEAKTISLGLGSGDMKAEGDVKAILQPGNGGKAPTGLFAGREPVFVTAGSMRYIKGAKRSIYEGSARFWQGKQTVQADTIQVLEGTGSLEGRGKVKSQFWHKPKDGKAEEKVEVSGDAMEFRPEERRVYFRKTCLLKAREAVLEAETIIMDLAEVSADMMTIVAKGSVKIRQGAWEGQGGRAEFAVPEETIVLLENPVLIDKDKGETRGDKLTFQLADGRILIENRRRDRSITVIKS